MPINVSDVCDESSVRSIDIPLDSQNRHKGDQQNSEMHYSDQ